MNISQITGVYFSPTGGTKRVTEWITERIADNREAEWLDLTDAVSSRPDYTFTEHELVVVGVPVYGGMIIGVSPRSEDMTVNVCKKKQLTNTRAAGSDDALRLVPPRKLSLEQCLEFLADDELLEVTPKSLRIRKRILDHERRMKAAHGKGAK